MQHEGKEMIKHKNSSLHFITGLYTICYQNPSEKAVARNVKLSFLLDHKIIVNKHFE